MKYLSSLKYFLGLEITNSENGLFVTHRKYNLDIISEIGLLGAKSASTPMEQNHNLAQSRGSCFLNQKNTDAFIKTHSLYSVTLTQ